MSQIDQFESVFRAASREIYEYEKINVQKILIVTDMSQSDSEVLASKCKVYLSAIGNDLEWSLMVGDDTKRPSDVTQHVKENVVELVITYRNLHSEHDSQVYSLGTHADMLTQKTMSPVLLIPHPLTEEFEKCRFNNTDRVMAVTDHMNGDCSLVNAAAHFTQPGGKLFLTHIEDERAFERSMEAISQIPEIDTDMARERIAKRLLKDPQDYIETCSHALEEAGIKMSVESHVQFGRHLSVYEKLIQEHDVDLLLMHAKDEDQLAMHGIAYPLAVEFRHVPLLMI